MMFLKLFLIAFPTLVAMDLLWIGVIAKKFYKDHIGYLLRPDVNRTATFLFYLVFLLGLIVLVVMPAVEKKSLLHAALLGGLFGLATYGTYDLVNQAVTKDWPVVVTVVDMLWGVVLAASVACVTYALAKVVGV